MSALDPKSASMQLWNALLAHGVSAEEATVLMNGYAHELAEKIRTSLPADPGGKYLTGSMDEAAELIDPETREER